MPLRTPRLRVLVDGRALPGVLSAHVSAAGRAAARFRVQFTGRDVPGPDARITVEMDGALALLGRADAAETDVHAGVTTLDGRDLAALLVDARPAELFPNQTASAVAEAIAARHGLGADVTATTALVGRLYGADHARLLLPALARTRSDWDLLQALAQTEGFAAHVDGDRLYFGPPRVGEPVVVDAAECTALRVQRQLALSRGVEISVQSWGTADARAIVARAGRGGTKQVLLRPNLRPEAAQALADRTLADLLRHERTVDLLMPGNPLLLARSIVALRGAGEWDGRYSVLHLHLAMDARHGFTGRVRLGGA